MAEGGHVHWYFHTPLYWEFHEMGGIAAVRKGKWKGILLDINEPSKTRMELYDLENDIKEENDVSMMHPDIVEDMFSLMQTTHTDSAIFPLAITNSGGIR